MDVTLSISSDLSGEIAGVQKALAAAIASIPPVPAGQDVLTATVGGNFFGGEIKIPVTPTPALKAWAAAMTAKLNAFAAAGGSK